MGLVLNTANVCIAIRSEARVQMLENTYTIILCVTKSSFRIVKKNQEFWNLMLINRFLQYLHVLRAKGPYTSEKPMCWSQGFITQLMSVGLKYETMTCEKKVPRCWKIPFDHKNTEP